MPPEPQGKPELRATRRAMERRGVVITEDLDTHFKQARLSQEQQRLSQSMEGLIGGSTGMVRRAGANFPGHFTPTSKYGGTVRRAQAGAGIDRVFDVPYNPFRNRVAVETPKNDKERRARYRYYAQYDPYVGAAIDLHSDFPLSDFELTHEDDHLQNEFNDMSEDMNLFEFHSDLAHEYWMVGEAFPFGFFDDPADPCEWTKFILLNPDLVKIIHHDMMQGKHADETFLQLDSVVSNIVQRGPFDPETKNAFHRLPEDIIQYARQGRPMPLSPIQISHFRRKGSNTFGARGESMMSRVLHILSYRDKLRDAQYCYPPGIEVMTDRGFVPIEEICLKDKVATYDQDTEGISFEHPKECLQFDYDGDMYSFKNRKIDVTCTANHRCLVTYMSNHTGAGQVRHTKVVQAKDVKDYHSFITNGRWTGWAEAPETVELGGKDVPIEVFLEFAGYYVSEGSVPKMVAAGGSSRGYLVDIAQTPGTASREVIESCLRKLPFNFRFYDYSTGMVVNDKALRASVSKMFGVGSHKKKVVRWIKNLAPKYQEIFLRAACLGDGTERPTLGGTMRMRYPTISKQLADDIQEMAWKCGYNPTMGGFKNDSGTYCHTVYWSMDKTKGRMCRIDDKRNRERRGYGNINTKHYKGKVYCLSVPNYFFVIRNNGRISIQGNTIADRHVCYDKETECLTKDGWKQYFDLTFDDEIGTVNKDTGALEWQKPEGFYINRYKGDMIHFGGTEKDKKIDVMVTPDHRMLVQRYKYLGSAGYKPHLKRSLGRYGYDGTWEVMKSQDVPAKAKFRACVDSFAGEACNEIIKVGDNEFHIDDYLRMMGWYLTEGSWWQYSQNYFEVSVSQAVGSEYTPECDVFFERIGFRSSTNNQNMRIYVRAGSEFAIHFNSYFGNRCWNKKIPTWVKNLPREKLKILVDTMAKGDANIATSSKWKDKTYDRKYIQYFTTSQQLADDVQEIAFKLGYAPTLKPRMTKTSTRQGYTVQWSESGDSGKFPYVSHTKAKVSQRVPYDDTIWCVMVPNTFFITRRNGKIAVQGNTPKEFYFIGSDQEPADQQEIEAFADLIANSWLDPNLAIVWHHSVKVQWLGAEGRILPLRHEITQIDEELMAALMLNKTFLSGIGPTYANASVALDVLISRYIQFRQRIERWQRDSVWAPLCRIHGIYKPTDAELKHRIRVKGATKKPWVPDVAWSKYELRDNYQKVALYERLVTSGLLPTDYLYHSLNLNPTQIRNKLKAERKRMMDEGPPAMMPGPGGRPVPGLPGAPPLGGGAPAGAPGRAPRPEEMAIPGVGPVRLPETPPNVEIPRGPRQTPPESARPVGLPTG